MAIVCKENHCPICNGRFRISYDRTALEKGVDKAFKIISAWNYGYAGSLIANEVIKGRDAIVRKIAGSDRYKFTCPNCGYISTVIL